MIRKEEEIRENAVIEVANLMAIAARTAPKGRGNDNLEITIVSGEDIRKLSDKMRELGTQTGVHIFMRDAENLLQSQAVVLIGVRIKTTGLVKCGMCGFENCAEKEKYSDTPCVFNTIDMGIALGSAVAVAKNHCIDNRIMYTIGQAALELGIMSSNIKVLLGIPLSVSSKSPFFDRKQ